MSESNTERLDAALAGRYRIERRLGEGGMATVYLADDLRHSRKVAVKVLKPELATALGPDRFLREIQIAARLQHPHVLPLYDSGEAGGFLFYVMPFVEGESLRERLAREGELPIPDAVRILRDVVDALTEAHANGVVHRDIKPENVLLRGRHALVADFGVAKAVSEATGRHELTTVGVSLGTPAYMAPEQAAADPNLDHRVDIYAVGVLAYELLAGRQPFHGSTPHQILAAQVTEVPRPVTQHRAAVPPALASVVMRCLEKRPADRWQTAEELLAQIEAVATPSGGLTPTGMHPVGVGVRRRPPWLPTAGAVLSLALIAVWWLGRGSSSPAEAPRLATVEQLTANPLETALTGAAISPDGNYLAYTDPRGLHVRTLATGEEADRPLPDSLRAWEVGWYPDGTRLFLIASRTRGRLDLFSLPLLGGEPTLISESVLRAAPAPDGSGFAVIRARSSGGAQFKEIWTVGPQGEDARLLVEAEVGETLWDVGWSPDGARLAVGMQAADGANTIRTVDVADRTETTLLEDLGLFQSWTGILPFVWCPDGRLVYALREASDLTSNVWTVQTDLRRGTVTGEPRRATQHIGSNVRKLSATRDCASVVAMLVRNQEDVWVAELEDGGTSLGAEEQVTVDERVDSPRDWTPDGALILESDRSGTRGYYRWTPGTRGVTPWVTRATRVTRERLETSGQWAWSAGRFLYSGDGLWSVGPEGGVGEKISEREPDAIQCAWVGACVTGHQEGSDFVFSYLDPVTGEVGETSRIDFREPFTNFALSPDGETAAVVHLNDNTIRLIEVASGDESTITVAGWSLFEFVAWSADGSKLFVNAGFATSGSYPVLLSVEMDGTAHVLRQRTNVWHVYPTPSPDGRYLAFGAMPFQGNAYLLTDF